MDSLQIMAKNPHRGPSVQEWFDEEEKREPGFIAGLDMENLRKGIVAELKRMRAARELSQRDLATLMDVSQPVIAKLELGSDLPELTTLHRFAQALGYMVKVTFEEQPQHRKKKRSARGKGARRGK